MIPSEMQMDVLRVEISRLTLTDDDVLVVTLPHGATPGISAHVQDTVRAVMGENARVLIKSAEMVFQIVSSDELKPTHAAPGTVQ